MRTNYPLDKIVRRKDDERRRFIFALIVIGVVTFLLIFNNSVRVVLNHAIIAVTRPLWIVEDNALVLGGDLFKFLRSHKGLVEENRLLEDEVFRLKSTVLANKLIIEEYDRLNALVGRSADEVPPVLGRVIVKPNRTPYDFVVIDVGNQTSRPVKVGDVARLEKNITVGRVVNVSGRSALVELFSSPDLKTQVLVGDKRLQAELLGRGGGNMLLELPRNSDIFTGDQVFLPTSGVELVGIVGEVISDVSEPTQKMLVVLPVNLFNLTWLEIYGQ